MTRFVKSTRLGAVVLIGLLLSSIGTLADEAINEPEPERKELPVIRIETSLGNMTVELFEEDAPITVKNFLRYVDEGFFDGTIFHRVIPNFMIQGGGFTPDMNQKSTHAPIENEATNGKKNLRGTLAMARTGVINSATSQFFINVTDNDFLNHTAPNERGFGYCVFGRVIDGMDVADKIVAVRRGNHGPHADVPVEPVVMTRVTRVDQQ